MNPAYGEKLKKILPPTSCPDCGSTSLHTELITQKFLYGKEGEAVELSAQVPVHVCEGCGFQFTDFEAESARDRAVRQHLGVRHTPEDITALREALGLKQQELADLSGIGAASLSRWENGALIQSVAYDRYLYLLTFQENLRRLKILVSENATAGETVELIEATGSHVAEEHVWVSIRRFRGLPDTTPAEHAARHFVLRRSKSSRRRVCTS